MGRCDLCGRDGDAPVSCQYCDGRFCPDLILFPNHSCVHEDRWWFGELPVPSEQTPPLPRCPPHRCSFCGELTPDIFSCPGCGNHYCALHRLPEQHRCGSLVCPVPLQPPPASTDHRKNVVRTTVLLLGILLLLAGYACLSWWSGFIPRPPDLVQGQNASLPQPAATLSARNLAATSPTPTPQPVPLKIPVTIRITPTPTPLDGVISYPHIVSDPARGVITKNYTFPFQNRMVTVNAGVNRSVYNGAKNSEKTVVTTRKDIAKSDWAPGYFLAFVDDFHQDLFYADLRSSFRQVRQEMWLSDDEYLELMAVFVQSLEYDTAGARDLTGGNRFPAETFVDGKGVCGDKSLLLAGLLSREGYDVALLLFEPEQHMAVGIRSSQDGYRNTSYAYLETTRLSYVGVVPDNLAGGIVLTTMPQVIPVGNGWKRYSGTPQTVYIRNQSWILRDRILSLESRLKVSGSSTREYNSMVNEHNRYVTYYNYINRHEYDRPGTFAYIQANQTSAPGIPVVTPPPTPVSPVFATCNLSAGTGCRAGSQCCEADRTCYAPCPAGSWSPEDCVCRL